MTLSRRQILRGAGGLVSLAALARSARAFGAKAGGTPAPGASPRFFLFVQVYGAWDVCLAFDPKDRTERLPDGTQAFDQNYDIGDVKEYANGIRLAPNGQVLGRWADRLAVVNGIDMEIDNGHIDDYVMTGFQSPRGSGLPYVQAVLAKRHPYLKTCAVPHLYTSYDGQFFGGPYGDDSITAAAGDFLAFLAPAAAGDDTLGDVKAMVDEYAAGQTAADRREAVAGYGQAVDRAIQVGAALVRGGFKPPPDATAPANIGSLLGQLFASGILGSATLSFGDRYSVSAFDTHADHYKLHQLGQALADLDTLIGALAQVPVDAHTSVLERTTVVMTAEFCRTPRLNAAAGKDHNFHTNSLFALGYGVKPGVYGQSGYRQDGDGWDAHAAQPIDFQTGAPAAPQNGGQILLVKSLWAGLGGLCGVDLTREFGSDTKPISFLG